MNIAEQNQNSSENKQSYSISDFILQNKIGSGSFGKVFKVKDKKTNKILVAKISINKIEKDSVNQLHDISREVNILSKLNHPAIMKFVFYSPFDFKNKPKPVIITEYVPNGSLDELIKKERESDSQIFIDMTHKLIIIYGIASSMSYLHSYNILHRDLKPDNILLDSYLFPKIADFGLSKVLHKNNETITMNSMFELKGTPIYISPEIWSRCEYTKAGDVYAFAIIVYELMTNKKPFENVNFYLLPVQVTKGIRPELSVQIPESYSNLIRDCWSQDPAKRPTFDQILDRLLNDHGFITETVKESDFMKYVNYINEYKSSFDRTKNAFYFDVYNKFNKASINENKSLLTLNKTILFPYKEYAKLELENKNIVDEVKEDPLKQFNIAISLIECRDSFSRNTQIGLKYLKKSIEAGCIESAIYYCDMLIKGRFIPQNLNKAMKIAKMRLANQEAIFLLVAGKIEKKKGNYKEAMKNFEKSIQMGNDESLYEYGKMLYKGFNGLSSNKSKAIEYYTKSVLKGNLKAMFRYGKIKIEDEKNAEEGNKLIKMSADKGYPKACYYYSIMLEKSDNKEESIRYLREAAEKCHPESLFKLGVELSKDPISQEEALKYLKKSCDDGNIESMYHYGMMLYDGKGIKENKEEAAKYLKISSYGGNSNAMADYGNMLLTGDVIPVDKEEALKLIQKGIELGNADAMNIYANMLRRGNGVPINKAEAIKYYQMAIKNGSSMAMFNYAYILQVGDSVPVNKEEAIKYYQMAIEHGNADAMDSYAGMLQYGEGTPVNKKEAIKYYKMAIAKGNHESLISYMKMLQYDEDAESDREEIMNIITKEINEGNSDVMNEYGVMLYNGIGMPINIEKALKYLKMAADEGNINGMGNYSTVLLISPEIPLNKEEAIKYLKMAIKNGSTTAMVQYADALITGKKLDKNTDEAIKYYQMAIDKNNVQAMHRLACFSYSGEKGIPKDKEKAIKYYKMAADRGYLPSIKNYVELLIKENDASDENKQEMIKFLKMGVNRGEADMIYYYGKMIYSGEIVDENGKDASEYMIMAINRGSITAMHDYGVMLYTGQVFEMNKEEGIKYLKMASDRGDADSTFELAKILKKENGSVINAEIIEYVKIAADKGCIEAMQFYALCLISGNGIQVNIEEALKYFKKATDTGDAKSMYYYATLLYKLDESRKKEAIEYFKMAADNNIVEAMNDYATILFSGLGIEMNKQEAFKYYNKAADHGYVDSIIKCADMLFEGCGVPLNKGEALKYYKIAAEKGDAGAINKYAEIIFKGDGVPADKKEGIKFFKMAIEKGDSDALFNYGEILFKGDGITQNKEEAIEYIKQSANMENPKAMYFYGTLLEQNKDIDSAIKYYIKSSNRGNIDAIRHYNNILNEKEKNDKFEENENKSQRKIERRMSFTCIEKEKLSLFCTLDESSRTYFIDAEFSESSDSSNFYIAQSLIEGKNNFPKNEKLGIKYLERLYKMKNVEAIKYYSKIKNISHDILNDISSIHNSSTIKLNLANILYSHESFDVHIPTSTRSINYKLIKKLSKESANFGNVKGMVLYSELCLKTKKNQTGEIKCDYKEAFKSIKQASKHGDAEAMSIYGNFLLSGTGCLKKDPFKAVKYFKRSYEKGNLNGYARYGSSLIEGEGGLQKNVTEGLRLIKYSFDHNNPIGITVYAYYLYLGLPILEKNLKLSFEYNKNAASMGYFAAISNFGACYHYGDGTDVDIKEAIKYYLRAIEEGSFTAARNLGLLLIDGDDKHEIKADYKEGMKYLKFASEKGDTNAMYYYSINVANNESTAEEIELMEYFLKKGVYLKVEDLILIYAQLLYKGNVLPQDRVKAARYYKMCADLGNINAMRMYGNCLYDGIGIEKNLDETLKYFKMAADCGSSQAMVIYASLLSKGEQGSFDQNEVIKYYKMAIEKEEKNENSTVDLTDAKRYIETLNQKVNEKVI